MITRLIKPVLRDLAGSVLYKTGWTRPGRASSQALTIVTFHRVLPAHALNDYPFPELAVSSEELAWLLGYFAAHYQAGPLDPIHERWQQQAPSDRPLLAITFDDGQRDNFVHARPLLDAAGLRASFFVPTDAIDADAPLWHDRYGYALRALYSRDPALAERELRALELPAHVTGSERLGLATERLKALSPERREAAVASVETQIGVSGSRPDWDGMMSWDQLRTLQREGHEIGSHSQSHPLLPTISDSQLTAELQGSKLKIEAELGVSVRTFCYPNGDHDSRVVEAVHRAGYKRAVTTVWGLNPAGSDPLRLSRCDMQAKRLRSTVGTLSEARLALRLSAIFAEPPA